MSMVSTWVRAVDGQLYKNPVIETDECFVCFDDNDPPEIVIKRGDGYRADPADILTELGVPFDRKRLRRGRGGMRCFSTCLDDFHPAAAWFFDLTGPIPVPTSSDAHSEQNPRTSCVIFDFEPKDPHA